MHFLVVLVMPIGTQSVKALPKLSATAFADHFVQRRNHRVMLGCTAYRGFLQRRPREIFAAGDAVRSH